MLYQPFQHTEPKRAYRAANRLLLAFGVALQILLLSINISAYRYNAVLRDFPSYMITLLLVSNIIMYLVTNFRHKMIISPAGINITRWRTVATPWRNVDRLETFHYRYLGLKVELSCLVLHSPALGYQRVTKHGIPVELRGRVIPILFKAWERSAAIEQDIKQYVSQRNDEANRGLFVPHSFAAIPNSNEKRNTLILIGLIVIVIVASFRYAFLL